MSKLTNAVKKLMATQDTRDGREKISIDDIIAYYPKGISITGIGMNTYNGSTYPVFTFAEEPERYFTGGKGLSEFAQACIEDYDGDVAALNEDLQTEHVRIKLEKVKTKRGHDYTKVTVTGTIAAEVKVNSVDSVADVDVPIS